MDSTHNSWPMRFGASVMLAIALLAWPATWHMAYAQALPQTTGGWDTSQQPEVDLSWVVSQLDEGLAENALINRRAQRLLRGDTGRDLARTPNLVTDTPVESSRLPNLNADPNEAAQAASQAARIQPLSQADIVNGAQQGSDAGQGMMGSVRGIAVDMERVNPDQHRTRQCDRDAPRRDCTGCSRSASLGRGNLSKPRNPRRRFGTEPPQLAS